MRCDTLKLRFKFVMSHCNCTNLGVYTVRHRGREREGDRECAMLFFYSILLNEIYFWMENVIATLFIFLYNHKMMTKLDERDPRSREAQTQCVVYRMKKEPYSRSIDRETATHTSEQLFCASFGFGC